MGIAGDVPTRSSLLPEEGGVTGDQLDAAAAQSSSAPADHLATIVSYGDEHLTEERSSCRTTNVTVATFDFIKPEPRLAKSNGKTEAELCRK